MVLARLPGICTARTCSCCCRMGAALTQVRCARPAQAVILWGGDAEAPNAVPSWCAWLLCALPACEWQERAKSHPAHLVTLRHTLRCEWNLRMRWSGATTYIIGHYSSARSELAFAWHLLGDSLLPQGLGPQCACPPSHPPPTPTPAPPPPLGPRPP